MIDRLYNKKGKRGESATKKYLSLAVTLGVMGLIFWFSAQDGEISRVVSDTVADRVQAAGAQGVTPGWFSGNIYVNIRKWAHIYIYCALGASMAATVVLWLQRWPLWRQGLLAAALCLLYAATDELHQYFVPGRAMLLSDIGVDALGFLPCIAAVLLVCWLWRKAHQNKS